MSGIPPMSREMAAVYARQEMAAHTFIRGGAGSRPGSRRLRRAMAADNPAAHQADLADGLDHLGVQLARVGRSAEALAVRTESVRL